MSGGRTEIWEVEDWIARQKRLVAGHLAREEYTQYATEHRLLRAAERHLEKYKADPERTKCRPPSTEST